MCSALAKNFIDSLLRLDPNDRPTAHDALKHPWLQLEPPLLQTQNLHRAISKNLLERQSTRNSLKSARSTKSNKVIAHHAHCDQNTDGCYQKRLKRCTKIQRYRLSSHHCPTKNIEDRFISREH